MLNLTQQEKDLFKNLGKSRLGEELSKYLVRLSDHVADVRNIDEVSPANVYGARMASEAILQIVENIKKPELTTKPSDWE